MPTLDTATRNAIVDCVSGLIDAGGGGDLVFETSGDVEVATCPFSADSFPAASSGSATANSITDDSSATGGTIDHVMVVSGTPADVMNCSIDTDSLSEFQISSLTISAGDTVSVSSMVLSCPAS